MGDGRAVAWKPLTPRRWQGTIPIERDGQYDLLATARADAPDESGPRSGRFRYRVTALADAPPVLVGADSGRRCEPAGRSADSARRPRPGRSGAHRAAAPGTQGPGRPVERPSARALPRRAARSPFRVALGRVAHRPASRPGCLVPPGAVRRQRRIGTWSHRELGVRAALPLARGSVRERRSAAAGCPAVARESHRAGARPAEGSSTSCRDSGLARNPRRARPSSGARSCSSALQRQQEIGRQIDQAAQELQKSIEQSAEREAFNKDLMRQAAAR